MTLEIYGLIFFTAALCFSQYVTWRISTTSISKLMLIQTILQTEMAAITHKLLLMSQAAVPISVALQTILVKELTHFHTPVLDALLVKLGPPFTLTQEEELQLLEGLKQRELDMGDEISQSEREAAHILPAIIKRVKRDIGNTTPKSGVVFQMVSFVPEPSEE